MMNIFDRLKSFFTKLTSDLKSNKKLAVCFIAAFAGIILIAFSGFGTKESEKVTETDETQVMSCVNSELKHELETFLEAVDGAGRVEVMISFDSTGEVVYACNTNENIKSSDEEKQERNYKSEHIIIKKDGNENGLTVKQIYPNIRGIAVVCDGGSDPVIKEQITSVLCALFNINSTRISVVSRTR